MVDPVDQRTARTLQEQLGDAYARLGAAERGRYVALLESIRSPNDVACDVVETGENAWTVTTCTADFLGALSLIVGLLTADHLDLLGASISTLRFPDRRGETPSRPRRPGAGRSRSAGPGEPSRRLLDVFQVRALGEPAPSLWANFRADLGRLLAAERLEDARDEIISRVSEAFQTLANREAKLLPMSVEISNIPSSTQTRLSVRSADTPGFLFAFTNALAGFTVNVERADITTVHGETQDTFWVTDVRGQPIRDEAQIHELRVATTLIKQFTYLLPTSPNPGQALRQFNALIAQMLSRPEWTSEIVSLESQTVLETLADLMGVSRFLWEDFLRLQHESLFPLLLDVPTLATARSKEALRGELQQRLQRVSSTSTRVEELNAFKDREMFRIDLRHVTRQSTFAEFSQELTWLGEVAVEVAGELILSELGAKLGQPLLAAGRVCPWCVCALGKFGGRELGFGSDLELIFVYDGEGRTDGPISILNSEYFGHFVQTFLRTLRARQEGIFEIDLRLRPYGKAGALASSLEGFAAYYSSSGATEQFERLALVRLRPVAGDANLGQRILRARDGFVYSGRPLDLANIRHLRHRQATELVAPGQVNAKYSSGGLVDLEYLVQAWQITVGATDATIRAANTLEAIERLEEEGHFRSGRAEDIRATYGFLRRLIDALRVVRGHAKDLTIPPESSREFTYLAHRLQLTTPAELHAAIADRMAFARSLWMDAAPGDAR